MCYSTLKNMYKSHRNARSKNQAPYNTKNSTNDKNSNHCVNNDFKNTFLAAHTTLTGSPEF